jgi:hypothetical protein
MQRRRTEIAKKALGQLSDFRPFASAVKAVQENIAHLEQRLVKLPAAPTEMPDVMLATEIRAHVARQKSPFDFAVKAVSDPRVLGALLNAPAFLAGLAPEHMNTSATGRGRRFTPSKRSCKPSFGGHWRMSRKALMRRSGLSWNAAICARIPMASSGPSALRCRGARHRRNITVIRSKIAGRLKGQRASVRFTATSRNVHPHVSLLSCANCGLVQCSNPHSD